MLVIQLTISLIRVRVRVSALHGDYLAISYINLSCGVFNCIYTCSTAVPLPRFPLPPIITCECMRLFIFMSFASDRLGIGLVRHYDSIKCDALALAFFNCFSITCQRMLSPPLLALSPFPGTAWPELISRRIINVAWRGA